MSLDSLGGDTKIEVHERIVLCLRRWLAVAEIYAESSIAVEGVVDAFREPDGNYSSANAELVPIKP